MHRNPGQNGKFFHGKTEQLPIQADALAAAADGIAITDRSGRVLWVNPAFTQITGYSSAEATAESFRWIETTGKSQPEIKSMWETILSGKTWRGELTRRRKDSSIYYDEESIAPIRADGGEVTHWIILIQDITPRKQREMELEAVVDVANVLREAHTQAEMLPAVLDRVVQLLGAGGAAVALRDPITGEMVYGLAVGSMVDWTGLRVPPREGISARVMETGQPKRIDDGLADSRLYHGNRLKSHQAMACVPMNASEQAIGVLWASRNTPLQAVELSMLMAISNLAANAIHRAALYEQAEHRLQRLAALHAIDEAISSSLDLSVTLGVLLDHVIWQLGVDAGDVLLLNPRTQTLEYAARRGFISWQFPRSRIHLDQSVAGIAVREQRTIHVPDLRLSPERFARFGLLAGEGFISLFTVPLVVKGMVKGVLEVFHRSVLSPDEEWMDFLEALAKQATIAIDNALLFNDLQRSNEEIVQAYDTTVEGWVRTLGLRDGETEDHTQRVTDLTLRLASAIDINGSELEYIRRGALLHDIGKMGVPDSVLLKSGPLTEPEREIIRRHPVYAYELLEPIAYLRPALDIPYCHHEKWDGTGYPRGLKGEEIPLAARLFAIADVWDALRSNRPYRPAWEDKKARRYLREQAGRHFDPHVVDMFFKFCLEARDDPEIF